MFPTIRRLKILRKQLGAATVVLRKRPAPATGTEVQYAWNYRWYELFRQNFETQFRHVVELGQLNHELAALRYFHISRYPDSVRIDDMNRGRGLMMHIARMSAEGYKAKGTARQPEATSMVRTYIFHSKLLKHTNGFQTPHSNDAAVGSHLT